MTTSQKSILILLWSLVFLWMGLIFSFSAETAEKSTETSDGVLDKVISIVSKEYNNASEEEKEILLDKYTFLIRKTAHFSIFAILGFFTTNALSFQRHLCGRLRKRKAIILSLFIGLLYAASDEIHQFFVPGRACRFTDVLIDFAGVLFGTFISLWFQHILQKKAHKKTELI